jgi:hypothetical protein
MKKVTETASIISGPNTTEWLAPPSVAIYILKKVGPEDGMSGTR